MIPAWAKEVVCKREVKGIDVSAWQANITQDDWRTLKKIFKADFSFIKATEGVTYKSATFDNDFAEAKVAGVIRGSYHFYRRDADQVKQADFYCNALGAPQAGDLRPVLDLEAANGLSPVDLPRALKILERIESNTGVEPMLYLGAYAYMEMNPGGQPCGLEEYDLWLPMYTTGNPFIPKSFPKLAFWQYTDRGNSTEGPIDWNYFNGSLEELKAYTVGYKAGVESIFEKDRRIILNGRDNKAVVNPGENVTEALCRTVSTMNGWA